MLNGSTNAPVLVNKDPTTYISGSILDINGRLDCTSLYINNNPQQLLAPSCGNFTINGSSVVNITNAAYTSLPILTSSDDGINRSYSLTTSTITILSGGYFRVRVALSFLHNNMTNYTFTLAMTNGGNPIGNYATQYVTYNNRQVICFESFLGFPTNYSFNIGLRGSTATSTGITIAAAESNIIIEKLS